MSFSWQKKSREAKQEGSHDSIKQRGRRRHRINEVRQENLKGVLKSILLEKINSFVFKRSVTF